MKVSYLILAHNNYKHLERLIHQLSSEDSRIYIHIDTKSALPEHLRTKPTVHFIEKRVRIFWGGFSSIEATLNLMEYALNDNFGDYYALISGNDYPVKSNNALQEYLKQGGEYINLLPSHKNKPASRYKYYHFEGIERRTFYNPFTLMVYAAEVLLRPFTRKKVSFKIYVGSTWFTLSKACIAYILQTIKKDNTYPDFYRNSLCADESFFQSIIGNSPFLKDVKCNLTYTDWSTNPAPAMITERHIELLRNSDTFTGFYGTFTPFFARKFDDNSAEITEQIKATLHR